MPKTPSKKPPDPNAPTPGTAPKGRSAAASAVCLSDGEWDGLISTFRREDIVVEALKYVKDTKAILDVDALEQELKGYLVYRSKKSAALRKIVPETLETALDVLHEIMHFKDRTTSMWIELRRLQARLSDYFEAASSKILIKRDVQSLRSEAQRTAVVNAVLKRLNRRMALVDNLIDMCENVSRSLYQTYQSIDLAIDIVKVMTFKRPDPNYVPDADIAKGTTRTGIAKQHTKIGRRMV